MEGLTSSLKFWRCAHHGFFGINFDFLNYYIKICNWTAEVLGTPEGSAFFPHAHPSPGSWSLLDIGMNGR